MITIDNYRRGDEERMSDIAARAFSQFTRYGLDFMLPKDKVEQFFRVEALDYARRARARDQSFAVFVARRQKLVVGYIVVGIDPIRSQHFEMTWGLIISLAVDPEYHHQGTGTALIRWAKQWFRDQNCDYVEVLTDQNNIAAIRAYEGAGFRAIYSSITLSQKLNAGANVHEHIRPQD